MRRMMCKGKIHRAVVTEANLHYTGSITIDQRLMKAANIHPYEMVQITNLRNAVRWKTYAIPAPEGSGKICLNGPPAHLFHPGDRRNETRRRKLPRSQRQTGSDKKQRRVRLCLFETVYEGKNLHRSEENRIGDRQGSSVRPSRHGPARSKREMGRDGEAGEGSGIRLHHHQHQAQPGQGVAVCRGDRAIQYRRAKRRRDRPRYRANLPCRCKALANLLFDPHRGVRHRSRQPGTGLDHRTEFPSGHLAVPEIERSIRLPENPFLYEKKSDVM